MRRPIAFILIVSVLAVASTISCKKGVERSSEPLSPSSLQKVVQSITSLKTSEKYRRLFNEMAGSMYGFQWIKDEKNPNRVDIDDGELYIPQPIRARFDLRPDLPPTLTEKLSQAIANVEKAIQYQRRMAVRKTLASQNEVHFWFDLTTLSEPYQQAAKFLIEASYYLHDLYKLQLDPDSDLTEKRVYASDDPDSIRLYERNGGAFCGRYGDNETCAVLSDYYEPRIGAIMWPDDMTQKVFDDIKENVKDPKTDPFLSPFTVVKRSPDGTLQATAYGRFEPFKKYLEKVAALMEQASEVPGIDKSFSDQLKLQAAAFRSDDPRPYFQSDEAWGKAEGELELTIGPYETYEDPYGTKAFFEFMLGAEDKQTTELVQKFMPLLATIEKGFSTLVGPETYKAREITAIPPLRVVNVIVGSGEMRKAGGPSIAFSLPNIGPMADEGRSKRVIFANHHQAKYRILKAIADMAIVPEQLQYVDPQSFVYDSTFHEIMHGIGPQRETKVGENSTVALSIGEDYDGIEEAKANVGGIWVARFLLDNGVISEEDLKRIHATYIAGLLRIMRFGAKEAHAKGAALEFGYLYDKGAIEIRDGRFAVNFDRMQQALNDLVAEIGRALAKGDKNAVKALLTDYPKKAPALLEDLAVRFATAPGWEGEGIPRDVALVYHVVGM